MALATARKAEIVEKFKTHDGDTGSPEVQVALLTERINGLTDHFNLCFKASKSFLDKWTPKWGTDTLPISTSCLSLSSL